MYRICLGVGTNPNGAHLGWTQTKTIYVQIDKMRIKNKHPIWSFSLWHLAYNDYCFSFLDVQHIFAGDSFCDTQAGQSETERSK